MIKIKIQGLRQVEKLMRDKRKQLGGAKSVLVGYGGESVVNESGQGYAIYVHEDLEAEHPFGQAKFLEEAPVTQSELARVVSNNLKAGKSLIEGLESAGQLVLERSEPLVPVDTYKLVESGFVRREGE